METAMGMAMALPLSTSHQHHLPHSFFLSFPKNRSISRQTQLYFRKLGLNLFKSFSIHCTANPNSQNLRTCKNCKTQFDPLQNHPLSCFFHPAHFGGETKRKFESVYAGGTMDTPDSGKVYQYWHCCGSEDPFDPGCTASPHASYDD